MPKTTKWLITYPDSTDAPNVPAAMQEQAESVDAALKNITVSPYVICAKSSGQTVGTAFADIRWNAEILKQGGITHAANDSTFVVPESGIYEVNCRVAFMNPGTTGTIFVNVNGVDQMRTLADVVGASTAWPKPRIISAIKLLAGDAVKVRGYSTIANVGLSEESEFQLRKVTSY